MNYEFPVIKHIDQVLAAIEDRPEFVVAKKDGYTVINYNLIMADTFPSVLNGWCHTDCSCKSCADMKIASLRRECRGIIFDSNTGSVVRRPFHKFFNVNELPETHQNQINLSEPHHILEKLDGSMIAPFYANGQLIFGTKMGATDVAKPVEDYVNYNSQYIDFARQCIESFNQTPIFEWCSRKQKIVLDYPEDRLILTGVRNMVTGEYISYHAMHSRASWYNIPVVNVFDPQEDMKRFIEYVKKQEGVEGFVPRFYNGHMVKLKCDWYVQIHKAKEKILWDRHIVEMILDNRLDDVKAHLLEDERQRLSDYEEAITNHINLLSNTLFSMMVEIENSGIDRKTFAIEKANSTGLFKSLIFKMWDGYNLNMCYDLVVDMIRSHLGSNTKYDQICDQWFNGTRFN